MRQPLRIMMKIASALIQWPMRTASGWITARGGSGGWSTSGSIDALPVWPEVGRTADTIRRPFPKCQRETIWRGSWVNIYCGLPV